MTQLQYIDPATAAQKETVSWYANGLGCETQLVRWGNFGMPLLLFPTAGGDSEEVERFFLIKQLEPFIHDRRLKVYSIDSVNGRTWLTHESKAHCVWIQKQYDLFIRNEVAPLIRKDCRSDSIEIMTAGASIGALNALHAFCRNPDIFNKAICVSGTFDIQKWLEGQWFEDFRHQSPLHYVPDLPEGEHLNKLRERFVLLATGQGKNEDPDESWKVANALGQKGIPNRVDLWDASWEHDWVTWREMFPKLVNEMLEELDV